MEPILVPGTPREAFNKHRHISDLVRKQVEHFKHIEERLPDEVRASLPQHDVVTENEAARYISAMTAYLLSRPRPKQAAKKTIAIKPPAPVRRPAQPLALAAAASPNGKKASTGKKTSTQKKSAAKKKSAPKKETSATKKTLSTKASTRTKAKKAKKSSSKRKK